MGFAHDSRPCCKSESSESIDFIEKSDHSQSSLSQCFQALSQLEANSVFSCTQQFDVRLSLLFVHILFFPVFPPTQMNYLSVCNAMDNQLSSYSVYFVFIFFSFVKRIPNREGFEYFEKCYMYIVECYSIFQVYPLIYHKI